MAVRRADLVNLHDIGVLQLGDRRRLNLESSQIPASGMSAREDHLQGDHPFQSEVPGLVDHSHAASADLPQYLVARHLGKSGGLFPVRRRPISRE
jgi:hypothetical protein